VGNEQILHVEKLSPLQRGFVLLFVALQMVVGAILATMAALFMETHPLGIGVALGLAAGLMLLTCAALRGVLRSSRSLVLDAEGEQLLIKQTGSAFVFPYRPPRKLGDLLGWSAEERLPLDGIRAILLRSRTTYDRPTAALDARELSCSAWEVVAANVSGGERLLAELSVHFEAEELAERLSSATGKPLEKKG